MNNIRRIISSLRLKGYAAACFLACLLTGTALIAEISSFFQPEGFRVYVKFDKKVFFSDEPVELQVCVKNVSARKNYFFVYDAGDDSSAEYITFQPVVSEMNGREVQPHDSLKPYTQDRNERVRGLERRMVELAPGEIFIHTVDLKSLFDLKSERHYRVMSVFYPAYDQGLSLKSDNELAFKIIEEKRYNRVSGVDEVDRSLSPSEVIVLTLKAEKDREWNRWEKYINVEKYIEAFPEFVQKYRRASFDEKPSVEREFVSYYTRERDDYLIDFKVLKEEVESNGSVAYVEALVDRFGIRWTQRYKYRFTLERYRKMWLVTDQTAMVMKGVRR